MNNKFLLVSGIKVLRKNKRISSILFNFFRILFIFIFAILPIVFHNIFNLQHAEYLCDIGKVEESNKYVIAAQAIGYSQPMIFFAVSVLVVITLNIINVFRKSLDRRNKNNQPKDVINSGQAYITIISFSMSLIFFLVMLFYSRLVLKNYDFFTRDELRSSLESYSGMMVLFIIFLTHTVFFEFIIVECGIKHWKIFILSFFFFILEISLSIIFIFFTNINSNIGIVLGSIIAIFLKLITFGSIFYLKIVNWKIWDFKPKIEHIKKIFLSTWLLGFYMFMYGIMMTMQMILISSMTSNESNKYLINDQGQYILILSRISVYNILNSLTIIPRSMSSTMLFKYNDKRKTPEDRIIGFEKSKWYCFYADSSILILGLFICIFSNNIVDDLYGNIDSFLVNVNKEYPIDYYGANATYLDLIKKIFKQGLFLGAIAQSILHYSIYYRIITYYFFKRNVKNFLLIILSFLICYGIGNYFLGVYYQYIFRGLIGYMWAVLIFGVISIMICYWNSYTYKRKTYNVILKNKDELEIPNWWKIGPITYYKKIRYYKNIIMKKYKKEYI